MNVARRIPLTDDARMRDRFLTIGGFGLSFSGIALLKVMSQTGGDVHKLITPDNYHGYKGNPQLMDAFGREIQKRNEGFLTMAAPVFNTSTGGVITNMQGLPQHIQRDRSGMVSDTPGMRLLNEETGLYGMGVALPLEHYAYVLNESSIFDPKNIQLFYNHLQIQGQLRKPFSERSFFAESSNDLAAQHLRHLYDNALTQDNREALSNIGIVASRAVALEYGLRQVGGVISKPGNSTFFVILTTNPEYFQLGIPDDMQGFKWVVAEGSDDQKEEFENQLGLVKDGLVSMVDYEPQSGELQGNKINYFIQGKTAAEINAAAKDTKMRLEQVL